MRENFPFDTAEEFLEYFEVEEKLRTMSEPKEEKQISILRPSMPDVPREDIVSLSQAFVVLVASFLPGVTQTQQIALYAFSAALAVVISGCGAHRRAHRNGRIAAENSLLIEAQSPNHQV